MTPVKINIFGWNLVYSIYTQSQIQQNFRFDEIFLFKKSVQHCLEVYDNFECINLTLQFWHKLTL